MSMLTTSKADWQLTDDEKAQLADELAAIAEWQQQVDAEQRGWILRDNGSYEMIKPNGTYVCRRPSSNPDIWEAWLLKGNQLESVSGYLSLEDAQHEAVQHWQQVEYVTQELN